MGQPIGVRGGYSSAELRGLAKRSRDADQARRLLSIAAVVDGASRADAAKIGGMDRQTLRDWVHRFNEGGPDGLMNHVAPGAAPKLTAAQQAELAALVERGPIPAVDGVVRWRACDLVQWIYEQFAVSVSDATVYRLLDRLGFSHVSARPKAYKQNAEAGAAFKKTSPHGWRRSARSSLSARRSRSGSRTR
jgi:putative transposase